MGGNLLAYAARVTDMQCLAVRFPWLMDEAYAGIPLRIPRETLTSLVDVSRIIEETGWAPNE